MRHRKFKRGVKKPNKNLPFKNVRRIYVTVIIDKNVHEDLRIDTKLFQKTKNNGLLRKVGVCNVFQYSKHNHREENPDFRLKTCPKS